MFTISKTKILAIIGAIAVSAAVIFFITLIFSKDAASSENSPWEDRIRTIGGVNAYKVLAEEVGSLSPMRQHDEAHKFGQALYKVEGRSGIAVCDSQFSFGCFHEFMGTAIADEGLQVAYELNEDCRRILQSGALSCQHGIGHGVVAYMGYDEDAMRKSLDICKELPYSDPIGGCFGGVFMEYNMRTMLGEAGGTRQLQGDDMLFPCNSIDETYAQACYFWQPQWWRYALEVSRVIPIDDIYARIGDFCREAGAAYEKSCFEGTGNNLVSDANFESSRARELCDAAAKSADQQLYCRSLAANSLSVGGGGKKGDAEAVCDGLAGGYYEYCISYALNASNIAVPGELPR